MNDFEEKTLRLKQQTGLTLDKEMAALLDLSPRAWTGRKKADSFPERDLMALVARRPDLSIDATYVLTGKPTTEHVAQRIARMHEVSKGVSGVLEAAANEADRAMRAGDMQDQAFLQQLGAVLPWVDPAARDVIMRMAYYAARKEYEGLHK